MTLLSNSDKRKRRSPTNMVAVVRFELTTFPYENVQDYPARRTIQHTHIRLWSSLFAGLMITAESAVPLARATGECAIMLRLRLRVPVD
jgi:hypothetical protein